MSDEYTPPEPKEYMVEIHFKADPGAALLLVQSIVNHLASHATSAEVQAVNYSDKDD